MSLYFKSLGVGTFLTSLGCIGYHCIKSKKSENTNKIISIDELPLSLMYIKNLTPHKLSFYEEEDKHICDIEPVDKADQLRLSSNKSNKSITHIFHTNDCSVYDEDKCSKYYNLELDDDYINGKIQISDKVEYDTITGLNDTKYIGETIVVSSMVAEYLMKNKEKYWGLCKFVMVPDTNPKNVVRNREGQIIGVKGLIYYGNLSYY
jgi:hypothetical protein